MARAQTLPQLPQLVTLVARFTSQPSAGFPLQSAKPWLHEAMAQAPLEHLAVAFARLQTVPQAPQFCVLFRMLISHPSAAMPLQSSNPGLHARMAQLPAEQVEVALGRSQTLPHVPQFASSVSNDVSQPSEAVLLQSP